MTFALRTTLLILLFSFGAAAQTPAATSQRRNDGVSVAAPQTDRSRVPAAITEADEDALPNFDRVDDHLFRGAQPKTRGLALLAAMGIRTVINLRDDDEKAERERIVVQSLGMRYFNVPMRGLARPQNEQIERVLALISDPANWPVFIHCRRGADRTGTVIACYRIAKQGWTAKRAISEAESYGMSFFAFAMRDYIRDYAERTHQPQKADRTNKLAPSESRLVPQ
ncbi:MAG: hypothetical protein C4334_14345 [Pyrinomonas sp.]|uniref:fused DSP-PTPase phosphatase/NAD kinase-like protein n=1 Tax=Pyrinomonas sp. TaxID=2080306 RepID=UPI00333328C2